MVPSTIRKWRGQPGSEQRCANAGRRMAGATRGVSKVWGNHRATAAKQREQQCVDRCLQCTRSCWPDRCCKAGCIAEAGKGWLQWFCLGLENSCNYSPMSSSTTSDAIQRAVSRDGTDMVLVVLLNER